MLCRSLMALSLTAPVLRVHRQIYHGGYCKSPFGSQSHGVVACVGVFISGGNCLISECFSQVCGGSV